MILETGGLSIHHEIRSESFLLLHGLRCPERRQRESRREARAEREGRGGEYTILLLGDFLFGRRDTP